MSASGSRRREERYPIVTDYYDPKFLFPKKTRTFCTNSRARPRGAGEVRAMPRPAYWYSVNGHAWSFLRARPTASANFALLKTVTLTEPLASGQAYARMLGMPGSPARRRPADHAEGRRLQAGQALLRASPSPATSTISSPPCPPRRPGDIGLSAPAKVLQRRLERDEAPGHHRARPAPSQHHHVLPRDQALREPARIHRRSISWLRRTCTSWATEPAHRGESTAAWASGMRAADGIAKARKA
ncbi:MAG: hypothetical protein MZU79_00280 [Anaerotruncus sp.]|nr:hypothetical protein [Anaerotruncus sp.]